MTDNFAVALRDDMNSMRRIPVRHVGIPLAEVVQVLGVEEPA
jgi:hypothetical protein